ncbi:uncharacterized protein ACIB01_015680 isoform 2-T2 [Guaruba guarouba]
MLLLNALGAQPFREGPAQAEAEQPIHAVEASAGAHGGWHVYGGFRRHPRSQLCPTRMYHSLAMLGPPCSREPPRQSRPSVEVQSRHLGPFPAVIKDVGST